MDAGTIFIMVSPLLLLVGVAGAVIIVALVRAQEQDVPRVFESGLVVFKWLADRMPEVRLREITPPEHGPQGVVDEEGL